MDDDMMLNMLINSNKVSKKKPAQVSENPTKILYDEFNKFVLDHINTNPEILKNIEGYKVIMKDALITSLNKKYQIKTSTDNNFSIL